MPIKRFLYDLKHAGELEEYMTLLVNSFNIDTVDGVMCRNLISLGWEGTIYDCDFNQMLSLPMSYRGARRVHIRDLRHAVLEGLPITVRDHCYGCTAGQGSSCGGALVDTTIAQGLVA